MKIILIAAATAAIVLTGPQADAARHHHKHKHHHAVVQVQAPPAVQVDTSTCTTNVLGGAASTCGDEGTQLGSPCAPGVSPCLPPCDDKVCANYSPTHDCAQTPQGCPGPADPGLEADPIDYAPWCTPDPRQQRVCP